MNKEIKMIKKNNIYELLDKPEEKDIIGLNESTKSSTMKMAPSKYTMHVLLQKATLNN